MSFLYVRPDESVMFAPCSGTVDTDFNVNWLTDGRVGRPAKRTGNPSWTITPGAAVASLGLFAAVNHTVDAARAITIGGTTSATITPGALPADGIPLNPFITATPASVSSITIAVSSNSVAVVMGEFYAGRYRTLERSIRLGAHRTPSPVLEWQGEFGSVPPYEPPLAMRVLTGETIVSATGLAEIEDWHASTRRGTRPTLIVPIDTVNDAWLVTFTYEVEYIKNPSTGAHVYRVSLTFTEQARTRW